MVDMMDSNGQYHCIQSHRQVLIKAIHMEKNIPLLNYDTIFRQVSSLLPGTKEDGKTPCYNHSLNVGQRLKAWMCPKTIVVSGYYSDIMNNVEQVVKMKTTLGKMAFIVNLAEEAGLSPEEADIVSMIVRECSYTDDECRMEKRDREWASVKRWKHASLPVKLVKAADIIDNRAFMEKQTQDIQDDYNFWALGLLTGFLSDFGKVPLSHELERVCARAYDRVLTTIL